MLLNISWFNVVVTLGRLCDRINEAIPLDICNCWYIWKSFSFCGNSLGYTIYYKEGCKFSRQLVFVILHPFLIECILCLKFGISEHSLPSSNYCTVFFKYMLGDSDLQLINYNWTITVPYQIISLNNLKRTHIYFLKRKEIRKIFH